MKHMIINSPAVTAMIVAALLSLFSCKKDSKGTEPAITITGFSVDTAWIGKIITINGNGFSATAADNSVRIGSTVVKEVVEASNTSLTIKIPAGATSGKVFVKVNGVEKASAKDLIIVNQLVWHKLLGGNNTDYAVSAEPTADGGCLVAGFSKSTDGDVTGNHGNYDYWVVKLNADRTIAWQKTFGGSGDDFIYKMIPLADGGCVLAGYSLSTNGDVTGNHGNADIWIVKLNAAGAIVWQKTLGGSNIDMASSVIATSDGYVVSGYTVSNDGDVTGNHGDYDFWVVKLNESGTIIWQKTFGGTGSDYANSIIATSDGGYLVGGRTSSTDGDVTGNHGSVDCWLVKLNATGNAEWKKTYGGTDRESIESMLPTSDGGTIIAGYTNSLNGDVTGNHGNTDCWVAKLNSSGAIVWQKTLGGKSDEQALSIAPAQNGGFAIAGFTSSTDGDVTAFHGSNDSWVVRLNTNGAIVWQKAVGGSQVDDSYAIAASGNSFIVAGMSKSTNGDISGGHGDADFWVYKILD
ncbi:T9SS C-terminal target domain-containing protein [Niastella caeni]|uniref:T9SS C-terminal target domain-containing protein n=1 Tax=Niastella caeni TaxID=2569763 RepID=A0A4S8HR91_9BACT|nr:IPT/TIG domain-containing protein [Niastella caeni]THU37049.1 T9SS C-terminal target domain-containing protein [Niastella caeni]